MLEAVGVMPGRLVVAPGSANGGVLLHSTVNGFAPFRVMPNERVSTTVTGKMTESPDAAVQVTSVVPDGKSEPDGVSH